LRVRLASDLRGILVPGVLWLRGATVVEHDQRLDAPLAAVELAMRSAGQADVAPVRTMYKRVGLDPTRNRPSSEALLRRVRRGDPLPRINTMVDVCNWCSLEFQLPYGLYDLARIEGDAIDLRIGGAASPTTGSGRTRCTSKAASRWPTPVARSGTRRRIPPARW
jgi:hypothetical protein